MVEAVTCYVALKDEGTDVWRPAAAYAVGGGAYVLSNKNYDADDEVWAVQPGSLVQLVERELSEGRCLVAEPIQ